MARSRTATSPRAKTKPRSVRATLQRKPGMRGDIFGHIPGIPVGRRWENRKAMSIACIHTPLIAGISGQKAIGAFSVVLAGEFADEDQGDTFTYIGSGGRASGVRFGEQTCDQTFDNNLNQALRMSARRKKPVRVLRGYKLKSPHAPQTGFRYDGLYTVSNPRSEPGPTGFQVCKFDFTRCPDQDALPTGEGIPEIFRSDIDIRREKWQESRRQTARLAAGPGSSTSRSSPSLAGGSRDTPISFSDDDDASEDVENEDIFGDIEDVEREMEDVAELLNEMKQPCRREEKKNRARLLLPIGRHVNKILERKEAQERDEAGRDAKWWYDALWSYVACAMPVDSKERLSPEQIEIWYNKWEERAQRLRDRDINGR